MIEKIINKAITIINELFTIVFMVLNDKNFKEAVKYFRPLRKIKYVKNNLILSLYIESIEDCVENFFSNAIKNEYRDNFESELNIFLKYVSCRGLTIIEEETNIVIQKQIYYYGFDENLFVQDKTLAFGFYVAHMHCAMFLTERCIDGGNYDVILFFKLKISSEEEFYISISEPLSLGYGNNQTIHQKLEKRFIDLIIKLENEYTGYNKVATFSVKILKKSETKFRS